MTTARWAVVRTVATVTATVLMTALPASAGTVLPRGVQAVSGGSAQPQVFLRHGAAAPAVTDGAQAFADGLRALRRGDLRAAVPLLAKARDEDGLLADHAAYHLAAAHLAAGQYERAEGLFREAVERHPQSLWVDAARKGAADALREAGDYTAAREAYRALLERRLMAVTPGEILLAIAETYRRAGDAARALETLQDLWLLYPASAEARDAEEILRTISRASGVVPRPVAPERRFARAMRLVEQREWAAAVRDLTRVRDLEGLSAEQRLRAGVALGTALFAVRRIDQAEEEWQRVLARAGDGPAGAEALYGLGRVAARRGQHARAVDRLRGALARAPDGAVAPDALFYLGVTLEAEQRYDEAAAAYERLVETFGAHEAAERARWRRAWLRYVTGRLEEAAERLAHLAADGTDPERAQRARYWRGRALERLGRPEDAVRQYRILVRDAPLTYHGLAASGRLRALGGDVPAPPAAADDAAFERLRREVEGDAHGDSGSRHTQAARLLLRLDLPEEADRELAFVLSTAAPSRAVLRQVSLLYADMEDWRRSHGLLRRHLDDLLRRYPEAGGWTDFLLAYPRAFGPLVGSVAREHGLDPALLFAVMREESGFDPVAVSVAGARGLVQVIVPTGRQIARDLGLQRFRAQDLFDPAVNLRFGAWYLARLLREWDGEVVLALAAYNAGPHAVARWLADARLSAGLDEFIERIPYMETRLYIKRVLRSFVTYRAVYGGADPVVALGVMPTFPATPRNGPSPSVVPIAP